MGRDASSSGSTLRGDETVLDAGAGTGRVTEMVLARLPRGHVIAVDGSAAMTEAARERLPADRVTVICSDLLDLSCPSPSTRSSRRRPSTGSSTTTRCSRACGRCCAAAGSSSPSAAAPATSPHVRRLGEQLGPPFAERLAAMPPTWNYATPQDTRERLERAGFAVDACWLEPAPATPPRPREFLETVVFRVHLARLPEELRDPFLDAVMERRPADARLRAAELGRTRAEPGRRRRL